MSEIKLPELPEAAIKTAHPAANAFSYGYHADQMTDYARLAVTQAVAAERARWEAEVAGLETKHRELAKDFVGSPSAVVAQVARCHAEFADELAALTKKD